MSKIPKRTEKEIDMLKSLGNALTQSNNKSELIGTIELLFIFLGRTCAGFTTKDITLLVNMAEKGMNKCLN